MLHHSSENFKKKISFSLVLFLSSFFILLFFQNCQKKSIQRNFILITLDTQRADYISSYNPNKASTPNIDLLAKNGTLYENCYSLIPITLPSHASIFFSEPPHIIKNYNNGQIIHKKTKRPSFLNVFKKNNFSTAAFISLGVMSSKFGLNEGFDVFKDDFPRGRWYLTAEEVNKNVFPWLEESKNRRFFLWIHYSDPHDPYNPPNLPPDLKIFLNNQLLDEYSLNQYKVYEVKLNLNKGKNRIRLEVMNDFIENPNLFQARLDKLDFSLQPDEKDIEINLSRGWFIRRTQGVFFFKKIGIIDIYNSGDPRQITFIFRGKLVLPLEGFKALYEKEVEYMDREIGKLWNKLRELNLFEKTHIMVVGDHGEGLGEYTNNFGEPHIGHIHFLYDAYMKVPLIIYSPDSPRKGIRIKEPVTLLDLAPTIMSIMDFKTLPHFQGRNLIRLKKGKKFAIFEETYRPEAFRDKFAILQFPWHFILTPKDEKYELYDLRKDPEEKENLYKEKNLPAEITRLKEKLDSFARKVLKGKEEIKIDEETKKILRSLGYIK